MDYLYDRVTSFTQDNGIDAIILEFNEDDNVIEISAIQIKTGLLTAYITMGTVKSTDDSKHFLAILAKADKGYDHLLFQDRYQDSDFRIKTFVLVTSKNVAEDLQDLKQVTICKTGIPFL